MEAMLQSSATTNRLINKAENFAKESVSSFKHKYNENCDETIDFNQFLAGGKSCFLIKVKGDSMINAGINCGDYIVVDKSASPKHESIVVAAINEKLAVKRLKYLSGRPYLFSENDKYSPIKVHTQDSFEIWGVVSSVIKSL